MPSSVFNSLLIQAVQNDEIKKVEDYLTLGASPDQMVDSKTHLMEIAVDKSKNPRILQLLIDHSKNKPDNNISHRLITKAIDIQAPNALKILLPFTRLTPKETLPHIFDVIKEGNLSCLKVFIDFKIDYLQMKRNNLSPLDYAAQLKRNACFQVIVNASLEDQYQKEFEKLKANTLSTIKSYKRWGDFTSYTSKKISGHIKNFEICRITELEKLLSICNSLYYDFRHDEFSISILVDSESHETKFKKFIAETIPKFNNLQDKVIALNKQKEQVPMIEEIQNDSKGQTFFSISRIPSVSQIQSINNPSQEPEISLSKRHYPSVPGI